MKHALHWNCAEQNTKLKPVVVKSPLQLVHTDLCPVKGKYDADKINFKYMLTFIDDFTHFTIAYLLKSKSGSFTLFTKIYNVGEKSIW